MTQTEATAAAKTLLSNQTALAFYDEDSVLLPYLIGIDTPSGELGVVATGHTYEDALDKAKIWLAMQKRKVAAN